MTLEITKERITITTDVLEKRKVEDHRAVACTARGKEVHFETRLQKAGTEKPAEVEVVFKDGKLIWAGQVLKRASSPPRG